ncbi:siderophore-interacting protein [Sphingobium sp. HWE2-09]|uniref:siderophore-interacting protein n=1 Tax=Sphingobium sp. HWE2-09 TaxID=3108390 RepID=UPI002DC82843|nr:siderophore-interacting protein [Sphingobium sp. HWE2-09]
MSDKETATRETGAREPGAIGKALIRFFMRDAKVGNCEHLSNNFHMLGLEGPELKNVAWKAGEKIQVALGPAFTTRTYTPIEWDRTAGMTRLLVYAHADGPGSEWVRRAKTGDPCHIFGPRSSLDLQSLPGRTILFGDETSIGLALAYRTAHGHPPSCVLEANSSAETLSGLRAAGLTQARVFERRADDAQLRAMLGEFDLADESATYVLTGKASSVQRLRTLLRGANVPGSRILAKAYWAPGKKGLD